MAIWFRDWSKTSKAKWMKRRKVSRTAQDRECNGLRKDAWKHAKPLDVYKTKAECKHCGFVSVRGGISRLKAHLAGGIPGTSLKGCLNVSAEVKQETSIWFDEWVKTSNVDWVKRKKTQESERHTKSGKIGSTALKGTIVELIEEKRANLQKEQSDLQKLEEHLALIS